MSFVSRWVTPIENLAERAEPWVARRPFLASWLAASLLTLLVLSVCPISYQDCDDVLLLLMCKGVGVAQAPEAVTGRMNVLLSSLLAGLYGGFPKIQWYSVMSVGTLYLSLWGLFLSVMAQGAHRLARAALLAFSSGVYAFFFASMQWTTTAALAALSGFFLLMTVLREEGKPSKAVWGMTFLLMALSVGIRADSFFLIGLLGAPVLFLQARASWKESARRKRLLVLAVAVFVALGAVGADRFYLESHPAWRETMGFFHAHFDLNETRETSYRPETRKAFDAVGWTQTDYRLFKAWYFLDKETYSAERLRRLAATFPRWGYEKRQDESVRVMLGRRSTWVCLFTIFTLFFLVPARYRGRTFLELGWVLAVMVILWTGVKLPARLYLPCLTFMILLLLNRAVPLAGGVAVMGERSQGRWAIVVLVLLWVNLGFLLGMGDLSRAWERNRIGCETTLKGFEPGADRLYVVWETAFAINLIRPFNDFEVFRGWNIVSLTWLQRFPVTGKMLDKFGVKDLFRDMVDDPRIRLVCDRAQGALIQAHLLERYGIRARLVPVYVSDYMWAFEVRREARGGSDAP